MGHARTGLGGLALLARLNGDRIASGAGLAAALALAAAIAELAAPVGAGPSIY